MSKEDIEHDLWFQQMLASEKFILLGKMAAGVAHEINNPIMIIQNYISLIMEDIKDTEGLKLTPECEYYGSFKDILKQCQRLSNITKNLLEFSRTSPLKPRSYDLKKLILSIVNLMQPMFVKAQIQVKLDIPNIHAKAEIVPDEVQQVFINLLDNAIFALEQKYPEQSKSPNKKYIKISLTNQTLVNEGSEPQEYAKISFFDDGPGIPQKHHAKMFEPFFSTKKSKANLPEEKKYQGMGLGLAYCKTIITKFNGFIEFESKEKEYTIFDVYLPLTKKTEEIEQEVFF